MPKTTTLAMDNMWKACVFEANKLCKYSPAQSQANYVQNMLEYKQASFSPLKHSSLLFCTQILLVVFGFLYLLDNSYAHYKQPLLLAPLFIIITFKLIKEKP